MPIEVPAQCRREAASLDQRGRPLLEAGMTHARLPERVGELPVVKLTRLTKEFDYMAFQLEHGESVVPVLSIRPEGVVSFFTVDGLLMPQPGDVVVRLTRAVPAGEPASGEKPLLPEAKRSPAIQSTV